LPFGLNNAIVLKGYPRRGSMMDERERRRKEAEMDWADWLKRQYARYWYFVLCLFLDVMFIGGFLGLVPRPTPGYVYALAFILLIPIIGIEYRIYGMIWGKS